MGLFHESKFITLYLLVILREDIFHGIIPVSPILGTPFRDNLQIFILLQVTGLISNSISNSISNTNSNTNSNTSLPDSVTGARVRMVTAHGGA